MGWLRKRFGEPSSLAGLGILATLVLPMIPPQYQMLAQGIVVALGGGAVARSEAGNR